VFRAVLAECAEDMKFFVERVDKQAIERLEKFVDAAFARIDYGEAVKLLEKSGKKFEFPVSWGMDLQTEHERFLTEEHFGRPVVVMNYPEQIKAFYMRLNDDEKTVAAMDVLAPGIGEIIGGSQARGAPGRARPAHAGLSPEPGGLSVVPRPAPLRHGAPRRLRSRARAVGRVRVRPREHPRRDPVPAHSGKRGVLTHAHDVGRVPS
jgi:hypothetical protein